MSAAFLDRASHWLGRQIDRVVPATITYRRGPHAVEIEDVSRGETSIEEFGIDGEDQSSKIDDWFIWPEDIVLDGERVIPQSRDEIDWVDPQGVRRTYRLLPNAEGRPFRWVDQTKQKYRVHTKEVIPFRE